MKDGTSLKDYGTEIYKKCHYTCAYCGFDGRSFENWQQLSIDHIRPLKQGGQDTNENKIVACQSCNSITSRMEFLPTDSIDTILAKKRERVKAVLKKDFEFWRSEVAPSLLSRPIPDVHAWMNSADDK
jgi:5-methylcytosine-specific restriction endonuclease McrA